MQSRYLNDKYGKAFLVGGSLLIWLSIFLLFKNYGYTQTWELWKVPTESPPFSDFRLIPGSAETFRMGIEPSVRSPGHSFPTRRSSDLSVGEAHRSPASRLIPDWISFLMI